MRVLVTGASGFVGWHVVRALVSQGHEVRALVRSAESRRAMDGLPVAAVYGDLETGAGLDAAVQGVASVFHVAALYSLERRHARAMYETNVGGTSGILDAIKRAPSVERLVYTSTTAAVGVRSDGLAADACHDVDPERVPPGYKRSKVLAEQVVRRAARDGLDAVIVNPSTPIGAHDVKPTPTGRMIWDAIQGRMPAYVDTGLNWVSVRDVAQGHILAWEKGVRGERYILGYINLSFHQLLKRIEQVAGVPAPRLRIPLAAALGAAYIDELVVSRMTGRSPRAPIAGVQLARHPMFYTAERAVRELGIPQTSIDESLAEAVQWFRSADSTVKDDRRKGRR